MQIPLLGPERPPPPFLNLGRELEFLAEAPSYFGVRLGQGQ